MADSLVDFSGSDRLIGGAGNDTLETDGIGDTLFGDAGDDLIIARGTPGANLGSSLDGGLGDDTIIGDLNATITGGDGADSITIDSAFGSAESPAVITDFDPAFDRLTIDTTTLAQPPTTPTLTLQAAANGTDVEVLVDGMVFVVLQANSLSPALTASITIIPS